jgi:hypothetical protein
VLWQDLEDERSEVRQAGKNLGHKLDQRFRHDIGVRVEPVASALDPPREVDFPDALERNLIEELANWLTAVALVRPEIVKVEQNPAIRGLRYGGRKRTVPHLALPRAKVADASLEGEWHREPSRERPDVLARDLDTFTCLERG